MLFRGVFNYFAALARTLDFFRCILKTECGHQAVAAECLRLSASLRNTNGIYQEIILHKYCDSRGVPAFVKFQNAKAKDKKI